MSDLVLALQVAAQLKRLRDLDERLTAVSKTANLYRSLLGRRIDALAVLQIANSVMQGMPQIQRELNQLASANRPLGRAGGQSLPAQIQEIAGLTAHMRARIPRVVEEIRLFAIQSLDRMSGDPKRTASDSTLASLMGLDLLNRAIEILLNLFGWRA